MQVLGDLIKLPTDPDLLPLPWWHRAPLGLQTKTWCYVALMKSEKRPVGDLIVSVLDPHKWKSTLAFRVSRADEPGVVSAAIQVVKSTNIALAESVTVCEGQTHEATLICEALSRDELDSLRTDFEECGFQVGSSRAFPAGEILWMRRVRVKRGWIRLRGWKEAVKKKHAQSERFSQIDLQQAVVSADTDLRLLRFVFPFAGARTVTVQHRDAPGSMEKITKVLEELDLNVLSLLLRRGGARAGNAILKVVCEPPPGGDPKSSFQEARRRIEDLEANIMAEPNISEGVAAAGTISSDRAKRARLKAPGHLVNRVRELEASLDPNLKTVFLSRRFVADDKESYFEDYADIVKEVLKESGYEVIESTKADDVKTESTVYEDVMAKMWVAEAAVILVVATKTGEEAVGQNVPHEYGFLQGQMKPTLLLTQKPEETLRSWTNLNGVMVTAFPSDFSEATDPNNTASIYSRVGSWIDTMKNKKSQNR